MKSLEERKAFRTQQRDQQVRSDKSVEILGQDVLAKPSYVGMNKSALTAELTKRGYEVDPKDTNATLVAALQQDDAEQAAKQSAASTTAPQ
jgi:hypothetical protein